LWIEIAGWLVVAVMGTMSVFALIEQIGK
jgi:hypothetical protein